jgi:AbrB family looped-hinge helix DNA binding protein
MKKNEKVPIAGPFGKGAGCCAVEAIITVDERGQMVLPKELRAKAGIKAGDKLAVTSWKKDGEICCIALIKAGNLETMVQGMLGPAMKDVL